MLIFGTSRYATVLGVFALLCPRCNQRSANQLIRHGSKFSLFFIPLFTVSTHYLLKCGYCYLEREVSAQDADAIQQREERIPSDLR